MSLITKETATLGFGNQQSLREDGQIAVAGRVDGAYGSGFQGQQTVRYLLRSPTPQVVNGDRSDLLRFLLVLLF